IRINVSCSRADLAAFAVSNPSSSEAHRPSFGRGCTDRSYSNEVSPDLSTFRTVFRDTFRSRAISLIVLPLMKCSRRIRAIVSTTSIPDHLLHSKAGSQKDQAGGVNFGRRSPGLGGQYCRPNDTRYLAVTGGCFRSWFRDRRSAECGRRP